MPREYRAYRLDKGRYEIWVTIRTHNGDEMHKVCGNINNLKRAREIAREFNQEIGVEA